MESNLCAADHGTMLSLVVLLVTLFFEAWLGRTPRTKANSILEVLVIVTVAVIKRLTTREKKNGV
jgi:hypothetical protein